MARKNTVDNMTHVKLIRNITEARPEMIKNYSSFECFRHYVLHANNGVKEYRRTTFNTDTCKEKIKPSNSYSAELKWSDKVFNRYLYVFEQ